VTPERWQRIEELFHAAQERPPEARQAFLTAACDGDESLQRDVESLLAQKDGTLFRDGLPAAAAALVSDAPRVSFEGRTLGSYTLGPLVGRGGMSDVYRARDPKLGRDVAVKILPGALARDPERLSRFEREARMLAALNHPNVGTIYGLEASDELYGLVLEFVEGATLAEKLAGRAGAGARAGALDPAEAVDIARQIAAALAAAHRKGIVHRDLKPANIKITPEGTVKVLDFGLAKFDSRAVSALGATPPVETADGVVLGTIAYMSPEQARGRAVDRRTDIWAFGCVLFEMLTGARPFPGETAADVLGGIMRGEPDWTLVPDSVPPGVRDVLRRCLTKDLDARLSDIAAAGMDIESALRDPRAGVTQEATATTRSSGRRIVPWAAAMLTAATAVVFWPAAANDPSGTLARMSIQLPEEVSVYAIGRGSSVAVSPDGQRVVWVAAIGASTQLYERPLDGYENSPIPGTEGGTNPFFSPDGRWIGFWVDDTLKVGGTLKKVPAAGGPVTTITDGAQYLGAAWVPDDTIVYAGAENELWRVAADGGPATQVTRRAEGELVHAWPQVLPGDAAIVYTIWNNSGFEGGRVAVRKLDGGEATILVESASYGRVVSTGEGAYLVFARPEGLFAAPFDLHDLHLSGPEVQIVDGVLVNLSGGAHFSFSPDGVLAYVPGGLNEVSKTFLWLDPSGTTTEAGSLPGVGFQYSISPDGGRLARPTAAGGNRNLWVDDLGRGTSLPLTEAADVMYPIWTPNGERIIYTKGVPGDLFWRAADGSDGEERLTRSPNTQWAGSVSLDGTLVYSERDPERGFDIWYMALTDRQPRLFLGTPSHEANPRLSPDGRWLAYQSNVSGTVEIYIRSFPDAGDAVPVSRSVGSLPLWSPDGSTLYYRTGVPPAYSGADMMAVSIDTSAPEPIVGTPRVLLPAPFQGNGDVAPDGRILLAKMTTRESPSRVIQVVLNWFEDLRARLPE